MGCDTLNVTRLCLCRFQSIDKRLDAQYDHSRIDPLLRRYWRDFQHPMPRIFRIRFLCIIFNREFDFYRMAFSAVSGLGRGQ